RAKDSAIRFEVRLEVQAQGGRLDGTAVQDADSATLILTAGTNFKNYREVGTQAVVHGGAQGKGYETLRAEHIADHQNLCRRVSLDLGNSGAAQLPTDERIAAFAHATDPSLVTLLFQYGRYLMIAGSRPGGQPATLQGLWNDSNSPPWDSKYTDNINTEMNYWPAEMTNLSECHLPLFDALKELAETGAITAREQYNARGWVVHHNFDLWR